MTLRKIAVWPFSVSDLEWLDWPRNQFLNVNHIIRTFCFWSGDKTQFIGDLQALKRSYMIIFSRIGIWPHMTSTAPYFRDIWNLTSYDLKYSIFSENLKYDLVWPQLPHIFGIFEIWPHMTSNGPAFRASFKWRACR